MSSRVKLYYTGSLSHNIVACDASDDTVSIAGDYTARFAAGVFINLTGVNIGTYEVESVVYSGGNTIITVTGDIGSDTGAAGVVTINPLWIHWNWALVLLDGNSWSNPHQTDTDRLDNVHRISPPTSNKRYVKSCVLRIKRNFVLQAGIDGTVFPDIVYTKAIDADTLFTLFHEEVHVPDGTTSWTRRLYYQGYFQNPGEVFSSIASIGPGPGFYDIPFVIIADGIFTEIDNFASLTPRTRPT